MAVGQVDIGNAATPMTDCMVAGVLRPDGRKIPEPRMDAKAVGDAVANMASLPLDANVLFMTVMASKMPFVGGAEPRASATVIASQRVGAKRRPMTGSAKQSIHPRRKYGLLRRSAPRNDG
jgi:hypothetical protein